MSFFTENSEKCSFLAASTELQDGEKREQGNIEYQNNES
jgi:hypothetical protein